LSRWYRHCGVAHRQATGLRGEAACVFSLSPPVTPVRIVASLPFVEALARRMAATMPNSIDAATFSSRMASLA
jgi:hypothetical protein